MNNENKYDQLKRYDLDTELGIYSIPWGIIAKNLDLIKEYIAKNNNQESLNSIFTKIIVHKDDENIQDELIKFTLSKIAKLDFGILTWGIIAKNLDLIKEYIIKNNNQESLNANLKAILGKKFVHKDNENTRDGLIKFILSKGAELDLSYNARKFIDRILNSDNKDDEIIQDKFVKFLTKKGAEIDLGSMSWDIIARNIDSIKEYIAKSKNQENLNRSLQNILERFPFSKDGKNAQDKLVKFAIEKGAEIDFSSTRWDIIARNLDAIKENIVKIDNQEKLNNILQNILQSFPLNKDGENAQNELAKFAIEKGAEIDFSSMRWDIIARNLDAIKENIVKNNDQEKLNELVKFAIEKCTEIDWGSVRWNFIARNIDAVKKYIAKNYNQEKLNNILQNILQSFPLNKDGENAQDELVKFAIEKGAEIDFTSMRWDIIARNLDAIKENIVKNNDQEKLNELVKFAIEKCTEIDWGSVRWNFIARNIDAVKKYIAKNYNQEKLNNILQNILQSFPLNKDGENAQDELVKFAIEKGAEIDLGSMRWDIIARNIDTIKEYIVKSNDQEKLNTILQNILQRFPFNKDGENAQDELVKFAIEKGAEIDLGSMRWDIIARNIDTIKEYIVKSNDQEKLNTILQLVLKNFTFSKDEESTQDVLIKFALEKGAELDFSPMKWNIIARNIDAVKKYIAKNDNQENLNRSLQNILQSFPLNKDEENAQNELVKFAIEKGAEINLRSMRRSDIIVRNLDKIKEYIVKNNDQEKLNADFRYILNQLAWDKNEEHYQWELIKCFLRNGAKIEKDINFSFSVNALKGYNESTDIDNIDLNEIFLLLTRSYDSDTQADLKNQIILKLVKDGFDITKIPLKEIISAETRLSLLEIDTLIKHGLDPRVLTIKFYGIDSITDYLDLAEKYNIEIMPSIFLGKCWFLKEDIDKSVFQRIFAKMEYKIDTPIYPIDLLNKVKNYGPKFKDYLNDISKKENFEQILNGVFCNNGSILHLLVNINIYDPFKTLLDEFEYDINNVNSLGRNALFYAKNIQTVKALIEKNISTEQLDIFGKKWTDYNIPFEIVKYAFEQNYLSISNIQYYIKKSLLEGNYEYAAEFSEFYSPENIDLKDFLVDIMLQGLKIGKDPNKYQAMLHLINKAGIEIPFQYLYLLNTVHDKHEPAEFNFLYAILNKLAQHYINLSKTNMIENLAAEGNASNEIQAALNEAFKTGDFLLLKNLCQNSSLTLSKITDKFSGDAFLISYVANLLDNDFASELVIINGLEPALLRNDYTESFFRGMKINLSDKQIDSYFKYGHQAFVGNSEKQKLLAFNINNDWNLIEKDDFPWLYGGTYVSVAPMIAKRFSVDESKNTGILVELRFNKNSLKICGFSFDEREFITSNILGNDVIAIYRVSKKNVDGIDKYIIESAVKNPYIDNVTPKYNSNDEIVYIQDIDTKYYSLCKKYIESKRSGFLFKDYEDFISIYGEKDFAQDQATHFQERFTGREQYKEDCFSLIGEVDLMQQCPIC